MEADYVRSPVSMKFASPVVEEAFVKSRLERMRLGLVFYACLVVFADLVVLGLTIRNSYGWVFEWFFLAQVLCANLTLAMSMGSLRSWMKACVQRHRDHECTAVAIAVVIVGFSLSIAGDTWGKENGKNGGLIVIWLSLFAICTHTPLSVRWCIMVLVDIAACVGYFVVVPASTWNLVGGVMLTTIVVGSSMGLYMLEDTQRSLFAAMLNERKQRVQAEFRATQQPKEWSEDAQHADLRSGGASTTDTGEMFRAFESSSLLDLVAMGKREQWLVNEDKVTVSEHQVLGRGGMGVTVVGRMGRSEVAIKVYGRGVCGELDSTVMNELRILRHLRHPNIVLFHGALVDMGSGDVSIVMERVHGKSYASCVAEMASWMPQSSCHAGQTRVLRLVAEALCHLHMHCPVVVHSDLKPNNILVEERADGPFPKLLDFGLASISQRRSVTGGTLGWAAPEVWQRGAAQWATPAIDVYAFGLLVFFTVTGEVVPRDQQQSSEQLQRVLDLSDRKSRLMKKWKPKIRECLSWSPRERPTLLDVYDSLFLDFDLTAEGSRPPWKQALQGKPPNPCGPHPEPTSL